MFTISKRYWQNMNPAIPVNFRWLVERNRLPHPAQHTELYVIVCNKLYFIFKPKTKR